MNDDTPIQSTGLRGHTGKRAISGLPRRQAPPLPHGSLVGREDDLSGLGEMLLHPDVRVVSIVGPGGVGKTRLALTLTHRLSERYEQGVIFVPLDRLAGEGLWDSIARCISLPLPEKMSWREAVATSLQGQSLLLVLDNCESMLAAMDELPELLELCPEIDVLTTSRETLRVAGEREHWLKPLDVPVVGEVLSLKAMDENPAVRLFTLRAQETDREFRITEENRETVGRIVQRLDGLPLAIELAAAQLRHLSPQDLLTLLNDAMPELGGGPRGLPERQQSLRELVRWSLERLPPEVRRETLRLGIFPESFTSETVATVLDKPSPQQGWRLLLTLADKSLVSRIPAQDEDETRFSMLQTIRSVLRDELEATPDLLQETLLRRARSLVTFAREADRHYHGPDGIQWLRRMRQHAMDVRMVVDESLHRPELQELALDLCGDMFWFWYSQGHYLWALPRIESLLEKPVTATKAVSRARAHVTAGWLAHRLGQIERADRHFTDARELFGEVADRGSLLADVGYAYVFSFDRRDLPRAIQLLEGVIERAPQIENAWHEQAAGHFGIALIRYFDGELEPAREHLLRTVYLGRAHNDAQSIGMSLMYLAHVDRAQGAPVEAYWKLREALPLLMEIGDIATTALLLDIVASTLAELGEHQLGREAWAVGEHLRVVMGVPRSPLETPDAEATRSRLEKTGDSDISASEINLGQTIDRILNFRPEVTRSASADERTPSSPHLQLSPRELEVLQLVARGMTSPEIAASLFVSPHTVKRHMANIREKLGVRSQAAAVAALREMA